ncbi:MAG TPA: efflux RND transporter periplasmic adaptor subunit [Gemmatimonadales bacterium]|jgi:membrane fusion protein, heavy metal efflux system|nr:efflux RND transporter periplasmic adaptor subunit [Gemmatimonadales bacterium]
MIRPLHALPLAVTLLSGCGGQAAPPPADSTAARADSTVVRLDSAQLAASNLVLGAVVALPPDTITLTGTLSFDPARLSHVGPRIQGRLRTVRVSIGTQVQSGDTLGTLDSPELGTAQATWMKAVASRDVAARNLERASRLAAEGIVSERRRLELEAALRERDADLAAAVQALAAFGAQPDSTAPGLFPLRTPLTGQIVEQHAVVGEVVGPESELFMVGNLDRLWLMLDLYEADLPRVREGAVVRIRVDALPGRDIQGRVGYVGAIVDSVSRSVKVRIEIDNRDRVLKPGMFAQASMVIPSAPGRVGIPRAAVQQLGGRAVVFQPDGPDAFRARPVTLGPERAGGWVEVLAGIERGDSIVVSGSFALKAHLQREQFGGDE